MSRALLIRMLIHNPSCRVDQSGRAGKHGVRSRGWAKKAFLVPRVRYGFPLGRLPQAIACGSPMSGQNPLADAVVGQLLAVCYNRLPDVLLPGGVRMCRVPSAAEEPCVGSA